MKYYSYRYLLPIFFSIVLFSCKKEDNGLIDLDSNIADFSIAGELYPVIKDDNKKELLVIIPQTLDKTNLKTIFPSVSDVSIVLNNQVLVSDTTTTDFSQPVQFTIRSKNTPQESKWTLTVKKESEVLGLGTDLNAANSLKTNYDFYYEQRGSGTYFSVNCGPTAATMAIKWADSTFSKQVVDARNSIKSKGGWWYTSDVSSYLKDNGINFAVLKLPSFTENIRRCIDKNYLVILCLDMYYVNFNPNPDQQSDKFYTTPNKSWGHFIVVKGYKMVDGKVYLECYDPISSGTNNFLTGQPKGKNRYYLASEIQKATEEWWNYAIVVSPKGKPVCLAKTIEETNP